MYGEEPKGCIYQNFGEYLTNPNVPLKLKVGSKIRRGFKPKNMKKDDRTCSEDTKANNKALKINENEFIKLK